MIRVAILLREAGLAEVARLAYEAMEQLQQELSSAPAEEMFDDTTEPTVIDAALDLRVRS